MNEEKKNSNDKVHFEIPTPLLAGLLSLYLLKQTVTDYQEKGLVDFWTITSGVFFLICAFSFLKSLRKKTDPKH